MSAKERRNERNNRKLRHNFGDKPHSAEAFTPPAQKAEPIPVAEEASAEPEWPKFERKVAHVKRELPPDAHELEQGNTLEKLVDEGRFPVGYLPAVTRDGLFGAERKRVFTWIPPEGIVQTDTLNGNPSDGIFVLSENGEFKGGCTMHELTPEQSGRIQDRISEYFTARTAPEA